MATLLALHYFYDCIFAVGIQQFVELRGTSLLFVTSLEMPGLLLLFQLLTPL